jgi:hypothetical protein
LGDLNQILEGSLLATRSRHQEFSCSLLFSKVWPGRPQDGPDAETPGITEVHLATAVL